MMSLKNFCFQPWRIANWLIAQVGIYLVIGIRSLLGPATCRYEVSCTRFVIAQLQEENIITAVKNSLRRVFLCRPHS